ncbi:alpha/beta fold hydrolase [Algoriphagus boritolerans]|uniref:Pimeloyl-ACP methyl ester carboxylesterase n=1 Tax=Algoriphagus boritolerans DSM 17298 = JCM 18970 TaxID=1120964 RepID=A0A1H5ZMM1_9BACT|nr:alpha/beta hydrolase [Algoriphagus boritolerans]SEG37380.1 Pimeloyl-ACP methyl ester carboxylesterase [Algoriphagus boritolerans DSM 17298 = JCM 18970]
METANKGYNLSIPVNNFNLSYDDLGKGDIPIIFLHGFPFDKQMWKSQLEFLSDTYRVIACDVRGFGKSSDEETNLSIDLFGSDLIYFMDTLGFQRAVVCGLSMGGYIALNAQARFPERFEAMILADTRCIYDSNEVKDKRMEVIKKIEAEGPNEFNEAFVKSVFHKDSLAEKKALVQELKDVVFGNSERIITEGLRALSGRSETCSSLANVEIPTLIICGKEDTVTPLDQSKTMHEAIEGSMLHIIEKAGHVSNLEQLEAFNSILKEFLSGLPLDGSDEESPKKALDSEYYGHKSQ